MELREDALPIRDDARAQIRSRIFLEGNFFVDIQPGSPSTGELDDGSTLPITQTASTVTLPDILDVLDSDVRGDLQTFLHEYGTVALQGGGAKAFNRATPSFKPAYRYGALTNDALLGVDPDRDVQRLLRYWRDEFWLYRDGAFRPLSEGELRAQVVAWLEGEVIQVHQENPPEPKKDRGPAPVTQPLAGNVIQALKSLCLLSSDVEALTPCDP